MSAVTINGERLWDSLMQMAGIGATDKGGCNRQALTELDQQGRALFLRWCEQAGCHWWLDEMGNLFVRRPGTQPDAPAVLTGSHLDTQPTGGKFDGVYGVLAGLEVIRTLNDHQIDTTHPIDIAVWTNEEGARFSPAMLGSGVWAGAFSLEYGLGRTDSTGTTVKQAIKSLGYDALQPCQPYPIKAAFELHIEQGPILEQAKTPIGVVEGVQGMRWYDLILTGAPVHAGPTPMDVRQDPVLAYASIAAKLYELAREHGPWARVTLGSIETYPGARNTVPERVTATVDLRHPDANVLEQMDKAFRLLTNEVSEIAGVRAEIRDEWLSPPVSFASECVETVQRASDELGLKSKRLFSGAGHDAVYVSSVAPTSMIFIPCEKGISHNEAENIKPQDAKAGANVLLRAILSQAGEQ
ncbi:N-carbamoyl-L-amino-acid hydrolase [Saliniradius amylolyticus]|uniref:N-carbamoyl-L-amino-acid hydrolase n=1 Tax=Saliniradius amylolyticus TaxID=2183582 RepID=A0A2S2DZF1_9ALTE|nr:Zn-dependent hydrolase [Saliniradius amylolyticus]AWL10733.1 N-carbamoyl-L-amino-acid hydrolase [Saliniradius amylolyticus]